MATREEALAWAKQFATPEDYVFTKPGSGPGNTDAVQEGSPGGFQICVSTLRPDFPGVWVVGLCQVWPRHSRPNSISNKEVVRRLVMMDKIEGGDYVRG